MDTVTIIILIFVGYAGAMAAIGRLALRQNRSFQDAITGGRQSSALMLAGSCIAGQIGSGFIIGGTEYGVLYGVGGAWYGVGCGLSCLVTVAMCRFIYTHGYISLTDYLITRYQAKATGIIYSGAMLVGGVAMLGGQLLAARAVLETLGIPAQWGVTTIAVAALIYANLSGLWGMLRISTLQAVIMLAGMLSAIAWLAADPGFSFLPQTLPESFFDPVPFDLEFLVSMTVPIILSSTINQSYFQMIVSSRSCREAQKGYAMAAVSLVVVALIPPLLGMFGHGLMPELKEQEVFTTLLLTKLPTPFAALILSATVFAVFIACNGIYVTIPANFVHSIYKGLIRPDADDRSCKRLMLALNTAICAVGVFLSLRMNDIIQILSMGSSLMVAGCMVPFLGGVLWKRGTAQGALAAACAGGVSCLLDSFGLIRLPYASISSVLISAVFYIVVSWMTRGADGGVKVG